MFGATASRQPALVSDQAASRLDPAGFDQAQGRKLRVLSLFAGIGGFDLGLERTGGFETVAFCEIEPFCQRVLAKHWPGVPCYDDVRTLTAQRLAADGIAVDCIVGGFPCQDISFAGKGAGLAGERSGLWTEFARLIGEVRPDLAVVENVTALLTRGLGAVLGTLASLGYDAEWHCIPAAYVGAPHRRDRIWIIAWPQADALRPDTDRTGPYRATQHFNGNAEPAHQQIRLARSLGPFLADAFNARPPCTGLGAQRHGALIESGDSGAEDAAQMADAIGAGLEGRSAAGDADRPRQVARQHALRCGGTTGNQWLSEPNVGRVANGVPSRVDRLRSLGNAVVPQIPELIGHTILAARLNSLSDHTPHSTPIAEKGQHDHVA